jgi:hypothetical protein
VKERITDLKGEIQKEGGLGEEVAMDEVGGEDDEAGPFEDAADTQGAEVDAAAGTTVGIHGDDVLTGWAFFQNHRELLLPDLDERQPWQEMKADGVWIV